MLMSYNYHDYNGDVIYNYYKGRPLQLLSKAFCQEPQDDNHHTPLVLSLAGEKPNLNES